MPALTAEAQSFLAASNTNFSNTQARATALPANTAQVWPGGQTFTTIQAAINSITGASPQEQYQVAVGPGTYNENVTMKDNVYVIGAGQGVTIITAQGQMQFGAGVVNSASNCGISELDIVATGGSWGTCPIGIKIMGTGQFHISGVNVLSSDSNNQGNNVRGISNNTGSYQGSLIIGQSTIQATGTTESTPVGIEAFGMSGFTMFINLTTIQSQGPNSSFGLSTAVNATATLDDSKIIAGTWALYNSDGSSPITANQCTIQGPVSTGVTVNN